VDTLCVSLSEVFLYLNRFNIRRTESVVLKGHVGAVRSVDFSHDSRHLLTGSDDKTVKVIQLLFDFLP
jgi:WD40 repeat protein